MRPMSAVSRPVGAPPGGHDEAVDEGGIAADTPYEMADREGAVGGEALGEPRGVDAHVDIGLEEVAGGEGFAVGAHGEACHERTRPWVAV